MRVFVYGTLKPGYSNYQRYCAGRVLAVQPAIVQGRLYHLSLGYPGLTEGDDWVQGYVLEFADASPLVNLDELEGYAAQRSPEENEYQREYITVYHPDRSPWGQAWVYRMSLATVQTYAGRYLPQGHWTAAIATLGDRRNASTTA